MYVRRRAKRTQKILYSLGLTLTLIGVGLGIHLSFATTLPTGNLLTNPGFESWSSGLPVSWVARATGSTLTKSTTRRSGSYSVQVTTASKTAIAAGINDGSTPTVSSTISGVTYAASCWGKASKTVNLDIQLQETDKSGSVIKAPVASQQAVTSTGWTQFRVNFTTSRNGDRLPLYIYDPSIKSTASGGATVWVDDCSLTAADTTPPSTPAGLSATAISVNQVNLSWSAASDNVGVTGYNIFRNGSSNPIGTTPSTTTTFANTGLSAGAAYSYTVVALDAAGNKSAASAAATVTTTPAAPTGLAAQSPAHQPALNWNTTVGATSYDIYRDGVKIGSNPTASYTDTTTPTGQHTYDVIAINASGASVPSNTASVWVIPTITYALSAAPNAAGWYSSSVTISFACSDNVGGTDIGTCTLPVTETADGAYSIIGTAVDNTGDGGSSSTTAMVNIDATPPVIHASLSPQPNTLGWSNQNVTITYTCSDNLSGTVSCPNQNVVSTDGSNQQITATTTDDAGNTASVVTTIDLDETPPTLGTPSWSASSVTVGSNATLSVPASDGLSGVIGGEYYIGSSDPGQGKATPMTYNSGELTANLGANLTPGSYTVNVRAKDAAENWSGVMTAAPLMITDQPASAPTGLVAYATSPTQVNLNWTASTPGDSPITGYQIYRNGTLVATATGTSYSDTGLNAASTYSYTVAAIDNYSVASAGSNTAGDSTPPNVSNPTYTTAEWDATLSAVVHSDNTQSVALPDGDVLWTFGDTTQINGQSTVGYYGYPHDSFVLQKQGTLHFTTLPGSFGYGWQQVPNWPDGTFFWMATPVVDGNTLYIFGSRVQQAGGSSSFSVVGQYVAEFDASTLAYKNIVPVPTGTTGGTVWGGATPVSNLTLNGETLNGWVVTGSHGVSCSFATDCKAGDLAYIPFGSIDNASSWQVFDNVIPATDNIGTTNGIMQTSTGWAMFTKRGDAFGGTSIEELTSDSLLGTWTISPTTWPLTPPQGVVTYGVAVHAEQAVPSGQTLVSYNVGGSGNAYPYAQFLYLPY